MISRLEQLLSEIAQLEGQLEREIDQACDRWRYRIESGRVRFAKDVQVMHEQLKQSVARFIRLSSGLNLISAPFIYSMIVPIAALDVWVNVYQAICFRLYGIPPVPRSSYIVIDRHHLAYLNAIEKLNCVYCGYTNGVLAFVREVAGRTEQYWCPIRHARRARTPHAHYHTFVEFGDAAGYQRQLPRLRSELRGNGGEK